MSNSVLNSCSNKNIVTSYQHEINVRLILISPYQFLVLLEFLLITIHLTHYYVDRIHILLHRAKVYYIVRKAENKSIITPKLNIT